MKTRTLIILSLFLFICHFANGQQRNLSKKIGLTVSPIGESDPIRFSELEGTGSYKSKKLFSFGISYIHPINNWLDIETGVEYGKHNIDSKSNYPTEGEKISDANLSLINIPLTIRANFANHFFANGGLLLDFETSSSKNIDKQSGVGALLGVGAQYQFNNALGLFINPYAKMHALIPFPSETYYQRLLEWGVRVGVTYSFKAK